MDKIENDINVFNSERTFYKEEPKEEPKKVEKVCPICGKTLLINFEKHLQNHFNTQTSVNNNKTKAYRSSNLHKYNKDWACPYCHKEMYGNETMYRRHTDYCKLNPNRKVAQTSKESLDLYLERHRDIINEKSRLQSTNPRWIEAQKEGRRVKRKYLPPKLVKKAKKGQRILRRDIRYVEWQRKVMIETKKWAAKKIMGFNFSIYKDERIRLAREAYKKIQDWKSIPGNKYKTVLDIYPQWWRCKYVTKYYNNPRHKSKNSESGN